MTIMHAIFDEKPPVNLEAEQAVLGCILIEPGKLRFVREMICVAAFSRDVHRVIFETMCDLADRERPVDLVTLRDALRALPAPVESPDPRQNYAEWCSAHVYLPHLMQMPSTAEMVDHYTKIVLEMADRRLVIERAKEGAQLALMGETRRLVEGNGYFNLGALITGGAADSAHKPLSMDEVQSEPVSWLWRGWVAFGKINMVVGDPGLGKSLWTLDIAARVSRGAPMPFNEVPCCPPSNVLLMVSEDALGDTIRPRLEAAGADLKRIFAYKPEDNPDSLSDLSRLERDIKATKAKLLIIDPLLDFLDKGTNSDKGQDVRRVLRPLAKLAQETGVAVIILNHLNKSQAMHALYRSGGSMSIVGAARSVMMVVEDPHEPEKRILAHVKGNLSRPPQSLRFHISSREWSDDEAPYLAWDGVAEDMTADNLLACAQEVDKEPSTTERIREFLRTELADGPRPTEEINQLGKALGYSEKQIDRARAKLVGARRAGGVAAGGHWELYLYKSNADTKAPVSSANTPVQQQSGALVPLIPLRPLVPLDEVEPVSPPEVTAPADQEDAKGLKGIKGIKGIKGTISPDDNETEFLVGVPDPFASDAPGDDDAGEEDD